MTQKQRSLMSLGVILLLAGGLGGAAWWSHGQDAAKKTADEKAAALFSFDKDAVTALTLTAKGQTSALTKAADGWRISQPIDVPADAAVVDQVLSHFAHVQRQSVVDEHGSALAKFGLDAPATHLVATFPGGTAELSLGAINEYAGGQYARVGGSDAVLLLEGVHDAALSRTTFDLREKRMALFDEASVQSVEVDAKPDHYVLEHSGATWKVSSPKAERADESVVRGVLGLAQSLKASAIADEKGEDLAKFGLADPVATMDVTLKGGKRIDIRFGEVGAGNAKKEYVRSSSSPVVAEVPLESHARLHISMEVFEDKTVTAVNREAVVAAQFSDEAGGKILVQRKRETLEDGGAGRETWSELAPKSGPAQFWKMNSILYVFGNLKAKSIAGQAPADLAKFGLDKPRREVSLQDSGGKELVNLKLGLEEDALVYVIANDDPRIFAVEKSRLSVLPKSGDELLEAVDAGR